MVEEGFKENQECVTKQLSQKRHCSFLGHVMLTPNSSGSSHVSSFQFSGSHPRPAPPAINTLISTADILQSWGSSLHCNLAILRKRLWISFSAISVLWITRDMALFRGRQRNFQVIYELGIQIPLLTFFSPAMFMKLVILKKCFQVSKDMVSHLLKSIWLGVSADDLVPITTATPGHGQPVLSLLLKIESAPLNQIRSSWRNPRTNSEHAFLRYSSFKSTLSNKTCIRVLQRNRTKRREGGKEGEEGGKIYFEKLGRNIVGAGKYETLRTDQQAEDPGKSWCYCSLAVYRQKSFLFGWISSLSFQGLQLIRWSSSVLCTVICFAQKITGLKVSHI